MITTSVVVLGAALLASAQTSAPWGQCGGLGYTGPTVCSSGFECIVQNVYFYTCQPITSTDPNKYWFAFGDSYSQTGFNISGVQPSVGNPLGNPPYPGWTGCGATAPNWVDFITTKYNASTILTWDLAHGGATIDANIVKPYATTVQTLTDQVNLFLNNTAIAPWRGANTLFSIWIGINDIGNSFQIADGDWPTWQLLDAYLALVQKLYAAGARNFLFINVPHVNRSPQMLTQSNSTRALEASIIDSFNSQMAQIFNEFEATTAGVRTWIYRADYWLDHILDDPTAYGFQDATSYGNATDIWCNDYHLGGGVNDYIAKDLAALMKGVFT